MKKSTKLLGIELRAIKLLKLIKEKETISIPIIAIILGMLVGNIILFLSGHNPIDLFLAIIRATFGINLGGRGNVFNARYFGEFLVVVMPICLTGLSVGFSFRTGLFNIGAEGQVIMGSLASIAVALLLPPLPRIIHLTLVILAGMSAGAFWGFIPGILKAVYNVHEVVVTIMLNYAAFYLSNYIITLLPIASRVKTISVDNYATFQSPFLASITNNSRLHWGIFLVAIAIIVYWLIMEKTTLGFELKSTGFNRHAALYSGINVNKDITLALMISGAFAGLAGTIITVGTFNYGRVLTGFENYGFDGIAVALVGNNTGIGILLSAFLFASLKSAQPIMQTRGIPRDIINIIIALIILFIAMQYGIKRLVTHLEKKYTMKQPQDSTDTHIGTHIDTNKESP